MARNRDMPVALALAGYSGVRVETYGTPAMYRTVAYIDSTMPAIAGGADLAVGHKLFDFPAGEVVVHGTSMNLALQQSEDNVTADTPDGGIGTTIASGVVAVLGGTAAFENMLTGQTFNDCDGTAEVKTLGTQLVIAAADSHVVHFNLADGWAADGDAALGVSGTVEVLWSPMS